MKPARGEVWLFDLGMEGKVRPVLVISVPYGDADRALVTILPAHDEPPGISIRDSRQNHVLEAGAFLVQNVATYPSVRALRKLGVLSKDQFESVFWGLLRWLGHSAR